MTSWKVVFSLDENNFPKKDYQKVFFVGMGGSSLPADLINDYLSGQYHLTLVRDYRIPSKINSKDLVIASSFSGNTEETLEATKEALERQANIIVLTNGGQLKDFAEKNNLPLILIPDCIQPRCATGYFFASILGILQRLGMIESKENELVELVSFLKFRQNIHETKGKELGAALVNYVPVIYGPSSLYGACRIWKIKFNENSKIQSFFNIFPELNHNEMVGFTKLVMKPALIYLKSQWMHPSIFKRMEVMKNLLGEKIPIHPIDLTGKNLLQEMFDSLAIADFASYYLAKAYGIDPKPVEMVEDFKKILR